MLSFRGNCTSVLVLMSFSFSFLPQFSVKRPADGNPTLNISNYSGYLKSVIGHTCPFVVVVVVVGVVADEL